MGHMRCRGSRLRGGGTSPYQRGERACPSLHVCVGKEAIQHMVDSSGSHISYNPVSVPFLWVFSARDSAPGRRLV
jgi:hypothetical protein